MAIHLIRKSGHLHAQFQGTARWNVQMDGVSWASLWWEPAISVGKFAPGGGSGPLTMTTTPSSMHLPSLLP